MLKRLPEKNEIVVEVLVRSDRASEFKNLLGTHGEVLNVIELVSNPTGHGLLQYIVACLSVEEKYIIDIAFMSFICNPKFQKYYNT